MNKIRKRFIIFWKKQRNLSSNNKIKSMIISMNNKKSLILTLTSTLELTTLKYKTIQQSALKFVLIKLKKIMSREELWILDVQSEELQLIWLPILMKL